MTLSNIVGPRISGVLALFPGVFTSLILILMPRIGGKATAALLANGQWGLIGFGVCDHRVAFCRAAARPRSSLEPRARDLHGVESRSVGVRAVPTANRQA